MSKASRDMKIVLDAIAQLGGKHSAVAIRTALSDAAKFGRERSVSEISKQVALNKSYIGRHLRVFPPAQKGDSWEAGVQATRRGVLLSRYENRGIKIPKKHPKRGKGSTKHGGVTGMIKPGQRYNAPKFFFVPGLRGSGATGIAVRTGKARDDYKVLHGPSVSQVFQSVRNDLSQELQDRAARKVAGMLLELFE